MKGIFRFAMLLSVAASLFSCKEKQEPDAGVGLDADFYITSSKDVIKSDGSDFAQLHVILQGQDVTDKAVIYDQKNNVVNLVDGRFSTSTVGDHKFRAEYGTYNTYNPKFQDNGYYTIKAISQTVPDAVADPQAGSVEFVHRAFLTQYTGTSCGFCPYMIHIVKQLIAEDYIPSKAILAAAHSGYNGKDEAAISRPKSPADYPYMHVDLVQGFNHSSGKAKLRQLIDDSISSPAKAGISVTPVLYEEDGIIVVTVSVKAAEDGIYNVGAWLLEDNIYSQQDDNHNIEGTEGYAPGEFDTHNNCVRIVDSDYLGTYFGRLIGPMTRGQVETKNFVMAIDKKWTNKKDMDDLLKDLHIAAFVSYGKKQGNRVTYSVCNAVDCPIDSPAPFEYK